MSNIKIPKTKLKIVKNLLPEHIEDITGRRYGDLQVEEYYGYTSKTTETRTYLSYYWKCKCLRCNGFIVRTKKKLQRGLKNMHKIHCGCLGKSGISNKEILEEAMRYQTKRDFQESSAKYFDAARHRGILKQACEHMNPQCRTWTNIELRQEALKYNTRQEFRLSNRGAESVARARGIYDKICSHMSYLCKKWEKEELQELALGYKHRTEFKKNHAGAYEYARKHKLLDMICKHMVYKNTCVFNHESWASENDSAILYVVKLYNDLESFGKVGITTSKISKRFSRKERYRTSVIFSTKQIPSHILSMEGLLLAYIKDNNLTYTPKQKFSGHTECFDIKHSDIIRNYLLTLL